jgi:HK97 family phage prohead protease
MSPSDLEHRYAQGATVEGRQLVGLAAPFSVEARIGDFRERIAPGAFARTLADGRDVIAMADHDAGKVLARTRSGTLTLRETERGLEYSLQLPETTTGNDIRALAARGDLGGVSFGFRCVRDSWEGDLRTLHEVQLDEISVVSAWPAYPNTTVALRSRQPADQLALLRYFLETCR